MLHLQHMHMHSRVSDEEGTSRTSSTRKPFWVLKTSRSARKVVKPQSTLPELKV